MICSECGKTILPDEYHVERHNPPDPIIVLCLDCGDMGEDDETWPDSREI